ncbi:MAG: tRNA (adenosine(37)-N6)-threonylcarbamoyltransferase complex ATPase subunit type 1 TsaE [Cyclobacteriaceae bacterium]|jgi:tRNA threonylcarbamoyladenosine biosynthesis protein TsaE|nr:tRNA (adenosine(37)-N6)-threonylcarbamoyltransferase complex ATPase subunit type 1 TsaE [Cyclobacteriaceae bacterium]
MPEQAVTVGGSEALALSQLPEAARQLLARGGAYPIWLLTGEMGAGKTTLVQALAKAAGIPGHVASPTFSLVNEYHGANGRPVYHFDFYRLKTEAEAYDFGTEEYLDSGHWCLLEWPERVPSLIPNRYFLIRLETIDATSRRIFCSTHE